MLLKTGDKIHVITRRQFENDLLRHFIGEVKEYADGAVRAKGYAFIFDTKIDDLVKSRKFAFRSWFDRLTMSGIGVITACYKTYYRSS